MAYRSGVIPSQCDLEALFDDIAEADRPPQSVAMFRKAERIVSCISDGRMVGVIYGSSVGSSVNLAWIYVHTNFRRGGIGRNLLKRFLTGFPECDQIKLVTHRGASTFFERLGFKIRQEAVAMVAEIEKVN